MSVLDLDTVKQLAKIKGTDEDANITALIPFVESWSQAYCKQDFTVSVPAGIELPMSNLIAFQLTNRHAQGVTNESIGGDSVQFTDDIPQSILTQFKPFRKLKFL